MTISISDIDVFIGIDVGKAEHWATALDSAGKTLFDKVLPNNESRLRDLYKHLGEHGRLLVVVDQPATIGALAVAVARDTGVAVGYLPGLSMRRIADLTPGSAKTDRRDAAVIAQAARTMPHTLRDVTAADEEAASLTVPAGSGPGPGAPGRARPPTGSGARAHPDPAPPWRRSWDPAWPATRSWRSSLPGAAPANLSSAGPSRIAALLKEHGCRRHSAWAQQVRDALKKQTVTVAGTDAAGAVLPHLARQLISLHAQRAEHRDRARGPGGWPTLSCPVLTTRARHRGPGRRRLPGRDTGQDPRHRSPAGLLRRPGAGDQEVGVLDQGREASPTQATSGSREPCSTPPSPPCAPTPSAAPTTSANVTRENATTKP